MNRGKMEQLRRIREVRRDSAEHRLRETQRLVRRREAVLASERRKLADLQREAAELMATGRPEDQATAGELLLADHQQRIANQQETIAKAEQASKKACDERDRAAAEYRRRQRKIEGIDGQIEKARDLERVRAERRAEEEMENLVRV